MNITHSTKKNSVYITVDCHQVQCTCSQIDVFKW